MKASEYQITTATGLKVKYWITYDTVNSRMILQAKSRNRAFAMELEPGDYDEETMMISAEVGSKLRFAFRD